VQKILTWKWKSMTHTEHGLCSEPQLTEICSVNVNRSCYHSFVSTNWKREVHTSLNVSGRRKVYFCVWSRPVKYSESQKIYCKLEYTVAFSLSLFLREPSNTRHVPRKTGTQSKPNYAKRLGRCFHVLQFCRFRSALEVCDSHNKSIPRDRWKAELLL
jgi:hypothetical protein